MPTNMSTTVEVLGFLRDMDLKYLPAYIGTLKTAYVKNFVLSSRFTECFRLNHVAI